MLKRPETNTKLASGIDMNIINYFPRVRALTFKCKGETSFCIIFVYRKRKAKKRLLVYRSRVSSREGETRREQP